MRTSIVLRLTLLMVAIICVSGGALLLIVHRSTSAAFVEREQRSFSQAVDSRFVAGIAARFSTAYDRGGLAAVRELAAHPARLGESVAVLVLDADRNVLAATEPFFARATVDLDGNGLLRIRAAESSEGRSDEVEITAAAPFQFSSADGSWVAGLVLLPESPDRHAGDRFASSVWKSAALWLVGVIAAAALVAAWFMRRALAPIDLLTQAARSLTEGQIPPRVTESGGKEFTELIEAFNSATRAIAQTKQFRQQLIADIAHELRTPVTNVKSLLEAAESGLLPANSDFVSTLQAETCLLERLVEDFQQLAISDAGQLRLNLQPLPLGELLESMLTPLAEAAGARLHVDVSADTSVCADEQRVRQVFVNLFENSVRHRPDHLDFQVTARQDGAQVICLVRDNGPGVAPEDQPQIFERFYRAEKSRNRATGGAGLGLAIVEGILHAMGGTIRYVAEERQGATFEVVLPHAG